MEKEIDFEQELYKHFGHVKDFTLCTAIAKRFYEMGKHSNVLRNGKNWKEKPVSEELEEEIEKYFNALYRNWTKEDRAKDSDVEEMCRQTARHFANWQKEQDKQWLAENHKHIFTKGRESIKQQIIEKACSWLKSNIACSMWIMNFRKHLED